MCHWKAVEFQAGWYGEIVLRVPLNLKICVLFLQYLKWAYNILLLWVPFPAAITKQFVNLHRMQNAFASVDHIAGNQGKVNSFPGDVPYMFESTPGFLFLATGKE